MKQNTKTRLSLVGILLLVVSLACLSSAPLQRSSGNEHHASDASATAETTATGDTTVHVTVKEFGFTFDSQQAKAGTIAFVVRNEGNAHHDFALRGEGIDEKTSLLAPGETGTLNVTLGPGIYEYECTIPGHDDLGMRGTFTVTP